MRLQRFWWVLRDAEAGTGGDGGGGGGGAAPAPAAAPAAAATPAAGPAPATAPAAAPAPAAAGGKPASALARELQTLEAEFHGTQEKFRVLKEDGALDLEATLAKTAEAYSQLEKRAGANFDPPPKAPGDYAIKAPDDMAKMFDPADPGFKDFVTAAHKAGFNQAQMDVAMSAFFQHATKLAEGLIEVDQDACTAKLAEVWADPKERASNYRAANRALAAFAGDRADIIEAKFGNDPDGVWLLAQIGKGIKETDPVSGGEMSAGMRGKSPAELVADMQSKDPAVAQAAAAENLRRAQATLASRSAG